MDHPIITPSIGRVVWFYPSERTTYPNVLGANANVSGGQPCSAQVAYVWHDRMVNLGCIDHNGIPFSATSVPLLQPGDSVPEGGGYATWMPYQIGQAAKTEQVLAETEAKKFEGEDGPASGEAGPMVT